MKYKLLTIAVSLITLSCLDFGRKAEYYDSLAYKQLISGDYSGALENYNKAFALDSTIADYYFYCNRGIAKKEMGDSISAIEDWEKAIKFDAEEMEIAELRTSLSAIYSNLGVTAHREGKFKEALEKYNQAMAIDSTDALYYINRGLTYANLADFHHAEMDYLKAISIDSTVDIAYLNMSLLMEKIDENDNAIHYLLKYIKLNPNDEDGYFLLAKMLYKQKRYKESIEFMQVYLKYQRNDSEAYYYLGMSYKGLGNKAEARRCLELARDLGYEEAEKELNI